MRFVILTGMSGSGKSTAMKMMEDIGFFCVDNLPISFLEPFMDLAMGENSELQRVAVGIDIRSGKLLGELTKVLDRSRAAGKTIEVLFLDADDSVLLKRYKETRRSHPLAENDRLENGIERERENLKSIRENATYILDTSNLLTRELKEELGRIFIDNRDFKNLFVTILSFGYKYGIPADSDLVFDVRFLPNPYYVEGLRSKTGKDPEIRDFVMKHQEADSFMDKLEDLVRFLLPNYVKEGKSKLVISIGCTGGKHRSVTLAEELFRRLKGDEQYGLKIEHRDIEKDALRGK